MLPFPRLVRSQASQECRREGFLHRVSATFDLHSYFPGFRLGEVHGAFVEIRYDYPSPASHEGLPMLSRFIFVSNHIIYVTVIGTKPNSECFIATVVPFIFPVTTIVPSCGGRFPISTSLT